MHWGSGAIGLVLTGVAALIIAAITNTDTDDRRRGIAFTGIVLVGFGLYRASQPGGGGEISTGMLVVVALAVVALGLKLRQRGKRARIPRLLDPHAPGRRCLGCGQRFAPELPGRCPGCRGTLVDDPATP